MKNLPWKLTNWMWVLLSKTLPTKPYLSLKYRVINGKWIDWRNPVSFTEKLQWLKVYGYRPEYSTLVDKVAVKDYVRVKIGDEYIIPNIGIWEDAKNIDFLHLPQEFILKCNHDSGTFYICKDKKSIKENEVVETISKALRNNYYLMGRETPYKYVERKVFAEPLLHEADGGDLKDYKFLCFNGVPKIFKIDYGRTGDHRANFYSMDRDLLPFGMESCPPDPSQELVLPDNFDDMVTIAKNLAEGLPFARIDLYNVNGAIYFGEITFYPSSGLTRFTNKEWDLKLGQWITLPEKTKWKSQR